MAFKLQVRDGSHCAEDTEGNMIEIPPKGVFVDKEDLSKRHPEKFQLVGQAPDSQLPKSQQPKK